MVNCQMMSEQLNLILLRGFWNAGNMHAMNGKLNFWNTQEAKRNGEIVKHTRELSRRIDARTKTVSKKANKITREDW